MDNRVDGAVLPIGHFTHNRLMSAKKQPLLSSKSSYPCSNLCLHTLSLLIRLCSGLFVHNWTQTFDEQACVLVTDIIYTVRLASVICKNCSVKFPNSTKKCRLLTVAIV